MGAEFQRRLAEMRKTAQTVADNPGGGFREVPAGFYVAVQEKFEPGFSKNDRAQIVRDHRILEGEESGLICRDWLNLEHEVGLSIAVQTIQSYGYEISPNDVFDFEASEKNGSFVFSGDFIQCCLEIENRQIKNEIEVTKSQGNEDRTFTNVKVKNVLEDLSGSPEQDSPPPPPPPPAPESSKKTKDKKSGDTKRRPPSRKGPGKKIEKDTLLPRLKAFCVGQGIDIDDSMTKDQIVSEIGRYEYPVQGMTVDQLVEAGYEREEIDLDTLITDDEAALLKMVGLEGTILTA